MLGVPGHRICDFFFSLTALHIQTREVEIKDGFEDHY
jgi:hypothetical protein